MGRQLNYAINFGDSHVSVWSPGPQQGGIASHQGDRQPLEQLLGGHVLLDALVAGYGCSDPPHLLKGHLVESAKSLHGDGEEGDPLFLACLSSALHLTLECLLQCQSSRVLLTTCAAVPCISCQCFPLPLQLKNKFSSEN